MTGPQSLQFVEHLRRMRRLKATGAAGENDLATASGGASSATQSGKLWELTDLSANEFADEAARFYDFERVSLQDLLAATPLVAAFSQRFLRDTLLFPYKAADAATVLAIADPTDQAARRAAEIVLGSDIVIKIASFEDLAIALDRRLADETADEHREGLPQLREDDIESLRDLASGAPVVRAVNDLLEKAIELRASDIHIEPFSSGLVVRMRVDGLLRPVPAPSGMLPQAVISRIKIIASLNIAERRLPQDGAARLRVGRSEIDIRVAIMPTQHGESAVIRLLPKDRGLLVVERLGFAPSDEERLRRLLKLPHGMIVITGPTGSGKTTTLATILSILNEPSRKILTIEDPVEYEIPGVNQSQVKPAIGLTFATALRSFVRQDPDVIMVGEVRDAETAHVAVHAALTGHLVLTTLHTETAAAALPRLLDLGIEGLSVAFDAACGHRAAPGAAALRALQDGNNLERSGFQRGSADSRRSASVSARSCTIPAVAIAAAAAAIAAASACSRCSKSTTNCATSSARRPTGHKIDQAAIRAGMTTMLDDGIAKCRAGLTSPAEILRVTTTR